METAESKLERAKAQMLLLYPWWASLLLNLRMRPGYDHEAFCRTMATDGTWLIYYPEFVLSLTDRELHGVLMHEVAHCALLHCYRRGSRDHIRWNVACDGAVNALLEADGIQLPKNCIPAAPLGKTAEELYESQKVTTIKIPLDVRDHGSLGTGQDRKDGEDGQGAMTEQGWRDVLAQNRGLAPAGIARSVDDNAAPKIDWREILAAFIHATFKSDTHTWSQPSRRVSGMPGWKREPESSIAICIDTSGSIGDDILAPFLSECRAICGISGIKATLISCDAAVHQVVGPEDEWPTSWQGGGGTAFEPAIERALKDSPDAIVYFTDGCGSYPGEPLTPILWCLTLHGQQPPYGEIIQMEN